MPCCPHRPCRTRKPWPGWAGIPGGSAAQPIAQTQTRVRFPNRVKGSQHSLRAHGRRSWTLPSLCSSPDSIVSTWRLLAAPVRGGPAARSRKRRPCRRSCRRSNWLWRAAPRFHTHSPITHIHSTHGNVRPTAISLPPSPRAQAHGVNIDAELLHHTGPRARPSGRRPARALPVRRCAGAAVIGPPLGARAQGACARTMRSLVARAVAHRRGGRRRGAGPTGPLVSSERRPTPRPPSSPPRCAPRRRRRRRPWLRASRMT
jgi:hypothetical protein